MNLHYGHLTEAVTTWVDGNSCGPRIVALDLETKVLGQNQFLTNERILSAAIAWRDETGVEEKLYVLESDADASETQLLESLDSELRSRRPLMLIGYNITGYDIPLLTMKARSLPKPLWGIKDTLERCFFVDLKHAARFEISRVSGDSPKLLRLEAVVTHPRFSSLQLRGTKKMLADSLDVGPAVFKLWKEDRSRFAQYARGDAYDTLLIFEELFLKPRPRQEESAG